VKPSPAQRAPRRRSIGLACTLFALGSASSTRAETLAEAIALAYRENPTLEVSRYDLRATDETYAQARAELRPTARIDVTGNYDKTVPGRTTQAARSPFEQLNSSIITSNRLGAQAIVDQPIYTGGRATADIAAASASVRAGRQALRGSEGDLLAQVITAYVDIRRDERIVDIRKQDVANLTATLAEVKARREAGELTRTDTAQAQAQLEISRALLASSMADLETSRANYAAVVGRNPGLLAAEPPLPQLPRTVDDAYDIAEQGNPELAQARYAELSSRAQIVAARSATRPTLSLEGTAGLSGRADPFYLHNEDQAFTGVAVLTVPLYAGGRSRSLIAQAGDRNVSDRLRIEAARRDVVLRVREAWNGVVTTRRNIIIQTAQVEAARVQTEGMFEEYRVGLRSTFDVIYAQQTLRDARISLLASQHDLYVQEATLLRRLGLLEARALMVGVALYDPAQNFRHAARREALPWDGAFRALDRVVEPGSHQHVIDEPSIAPGAPNIVATRHVGPGDALATRSPVTPIPGTVGRPVPTAKPYR